MVFNISIQLEKIRGNSMKEGLKFKKKRMLACWEINKSLGFSLRSGCDTTRMQCGDGKNCGKKSQAGLSSGTK